ncbi:S1 family peptidase [Streptococcus cuniculipharyngis]|uniref:Serine protease n=1 Tax=Streptococcus cuniculipharyngis TaxID=1562651 RepID=A0A5C5SEB5_9STRE|nr:trypsin-like peptidase domain-containing protein [Streptococcus cuniculipharyngis]TWS98752.1 trypsin-like serine protease [Streptococcus cuniculipharyngis]
MKKRLSLCLVILLSSLALMACSKKTDQLSAESQGTRTQVTAIEKSRYSNTGMVYDKDNPKNYGTASFLQADTLITNRHVITGIDKMKNAVVRVLDKNGKVVELPVKSYAIPEDETMDVGILKLQTPISSNPQLSHIKFLKMADEKVIQSVKKGQLVRTVGYPGDKDFGTLWDSHGVLKNIEGNFLTFNAPITSGSSGSPIYDSQFNLIGLSNASTEDPNKPTTYGFLFDKAIRTFVNKNLNS